MLLASVAACPSCPSVIEARALVFSDGFLVNAWYVLLPLGVVLAISRARLRPLVTAGAVLGLGLGGFFDGILLHQILQWHNMLSSVVPPTDLVSMKYNMVWDGAFHAVTWIACLVGVALLFRAARKERVAWDGRVLVGSMIGGWGAFNLVEGVVDHFLLGIHHVHPGEHQLAWDLGFVLIGGVGLLLAGYALARSARNTDRHGERRLEALGHVPPPRG